MFLAKMFVIFSRNMCNCPDCQLLVGMCFVGWSMCCRPECWLSSTGMCVVEWKRVCCE